MKVLFTIAGLHPESGGPARSVPALCHALHQDGAEVEIVALAYGGKFGQPLMPPGPSVRTTFVDCSAALARRMQWTPRFQSVLRARCQGARAQVVHDTGLWLLTNHAAAKVCAEFSLPRIVSPRGMLAAWALQHKGWKKRVAWALYQCRDLKSVNLLHATSRAEAEDFRTAGLKQPIAVIPNGVDLPLLNFQLSTFNSQPLTRTVLFLGRIHPVKGLQNLVKAWAMIRPQGWRMVIAGREEAGHLSELKSEIRALKLEASFEFIGSVAGQAKWDLYRGADLFVLPSHSENFGIVVAEALACAVPVITTRGTPWEDLVTHRCGWWTNNGHEPLAEALRDAMSRTDEERQEMGRRGRELVAKNYSWPGIAAQMHAVYRWMLGQGAKPDCVTVSR